MEFREGQAADIPVLATMFRQMWLEIGIPPQDIVSDWQGRVERFAQQAEAAGFRFFVADHEGTAVGCAACQRFEGLYPDVIEPRRRRSGYVWGVFVDAAHRRQGVARRLTERCVEALRKAACSDVILHASPMGRGVYERLGFQPTSEMRLRLADPP